MLEALKEQVYKANMQLPAHHLITFTWGNVSGIDRESGIMAIKPSGVEYDVLRPEDIVLVDIRTGKTVEGALGGVAGSIAAGVLLTAAYGVLSAQYPVISIQIRPQHYLLLVLMGAVASVLGILGDLFASAVKRQAGIKDYGTIFPGHGGILDRFDSVMFIAPFVSIVVRYFLYVM